MIPVARVREPARYRAAKARGEAWRKANRRAKRPLDVWTPFLQHLDDGFGHRCGYAAMLDPTGGSVDHYLSWRNHPARAYEWSNFRFVSNVLNSSKRNADDSVLDPYQVKAGWFEVLLPSLQLCLTDKVPAALRAKADFTLKRLKLRDGEKLVRWRRRYYEKYQQGHLDLEGLRDLAPLIADAVEKQARSSATEKTHAARQAAAKRKKPARAARRSVTGSATSARAAGPKAGKPQKAGSRRQGK